MASIQPSNSLHPIDVSSDINILQSLDPSTIQHLFPSLAPSPSTSSALELLDSFTPGGSDAEASQRLIKAYGRDMKQNVLQGDRSLEEGLAQRIDQVREEGAGIQDALGKVSS